MKPNYRQIAEQLIERIGGKDNIEQAAHCVTRLRLTLKDQSLVEQDALLEVPLVKGAFLNAGVYQIVIGAGDVDRVYAEFIQLTGLKATTIADVKSSGASKMNPFQKLIKVFSDVFMPIIPAIIVAGLLMGINNLFGIEFGGKTMIDRYPNLQGLWDLINMMANTAFVFLPAL
ncbi:MAG: PTS transporter subunit EIIB, partial [Exiguobacterium oxidotolerans]